MSGNRDDDNDHIRSAVNPGRCDSAAFSFGGRFGSFLYKFDEAFGFEVVFEVAQPLSLTLARVEDRQVVSVTIAALQLLKENSNNSSLDSD
ncbi:hypothetical protein C1H76_2673 [Elsinoe australis]|uniref:Uncharacterized protein n=1 Tax=Elsinoe australis TaxID=40998 RepID=A0A4U7BB60_9PEZI|nr:hypothetical protein C1H76_2673 [Elsinoe australis]